MFMLMREYCACCRYLIIQLLSDNMFCNLILSGLVCSKLGEAFKVDSILMNVAYLFFLIDIKKYSTTEF